MGPAPVVRRLPGVVVDVGLSRTTCLDLSSIRGPSARDHPALPARGPRFADRFRRRNRGSASNLLPSRRWFVGLFLAVLLVSLMKNVVMTGALQGPFNVAFPPLWIAGAPSAA